MKFFKKLKKQEMKAMNLALYKVRFKSKPKQKIKIINLKIILSKIHFKINNQKLKQINNELTQIFPS